MFPDPALVLERLCVERGEDFAGLSRMLGRNAAYIQQFVRRGVPKRLKEEERRKLARYFAVPEAMLGGPPDLTGPVDGLVTVNRTPVRASAGPGALVSEEFGRPYFAFDERWLKVLDRQPADKLSIIRVEGDSMAPTLNPGDDILVDLGECDERLRDGIYVLRIDDALVVKRIALHPMGRRLTVQSDNPAYPDWPDCDIGEVHCLGRVIWAGRKLDLSVSGGGRSATATAPARAPAAVPISTPFIGLRMARPGANPARMNKVRKQPPARVVRDAMIGPCQSRGSEATPERQRKDGQRRVDDGCRQSGKSSRLRRGPWTVPSSTGGPRSTTPPS